MNPLWWAPIFVLSVFLGAAHSPLGAVVAALLCLLACYLHFRYDLT
jgi:hypothetical protein